ncbi:unnamed protein product [Ambrosiozyma monospora]|uniref:Unnamed protein product n=1 Tax=Ambrosiozyma monospora TaxID=43982 RepID=A0A9W6WEJ1_AMBMO|nr:unnamed protein product [Ambrosiozyma monospora]
MSNGELTTVSTTSSIHASGVTSGQSLIETSVVSTLANGQVTTVASSTLVPVLEFFDGAIANSAKGFSIFGYVLVMFCALL